MKKQDLYIEQVFMNTSEIMPENIKVQVLNNIKSRLDKAQTDASLNLDETAVLPILSAIETLSLIIEDAYNITMYKFQFKLITNSLNTEIKNLEEMITYG